MNDIKKKALGRGLDALLGDDEDFDFVLNKTEDFIPQNSIAINLLYPSPLQPRKEFNQESLESLVESIREKGVLQPLLVRKNGNKYEIIAGERRYRAAKMARLQELPIIEKNISDKEVLEIALIENLMRENLNQDNIIEKIALEYTSEEKNYLIKIWNYCYISNIDLINDFMKKADAFIIVYSVLDKNSFNNI